MIHFFDAGAPKGYLVVFQEAATKFEVIKSGCLSPEQLEYAAAKLGVSASIFDFEGDVAGPKKAAAFIEAHKTPKNADLPEGFWRELELMSKGGVGVALPSEKAEIKSTPKKRRPSASPERSAKSEES